ncbi:hypothetical protein [Halobacillus litoralis]|nr:hypothetical protein [Halobacillus litoralis]
MVTHAGTARAGDRPSLSSQLCPYPRQASTEKQQLQQLPREKRVFQ